MNLQGFFRHTLMLAAAARFRKRGVTREVSPLKTFGSPPWAARGRVSVVIFKNDDQHPQRRGANDETDDEAERSGIPQESIDESHQAREASAGLGVTDNWREGRRTNAFGALETAACEGRSRRSSRDRICDGCAAEAPRFRRAGASVAQCTAS